MILFICLFSGTMDLKTFRSHLIMFAAALVLLLILVSTPCDAKSAKFFPLSCRHKCNAINALETQGVETLAVCSACGEMYGWEYEHCCLCDFPFYETCRNALNLN